MTDHSPEAVVAGEAAASAVEEFQSREQLAAETEMATGMSSAALDVAAEAEECAETALSAAVSASDAVADVSYQAESAAAVASDAAATAEASLDVSGRVLQELESVRNDNAELRSMFAAFLERTAPKTDESGVNEVTVNDGQPAEHPAEAAGTTEETEHGTPAPGRNGRQLRRRIGR